MNHVKRFAAAALSLVMTASLFAQPALAAAAAPTAESDGWVYIDNGDGTVNVQDLTLLMQSLTA